MEKGMLRINFTRFSETELIDSWKNTLTGNKTKQLPENNFLQMWSEKWNTETLCYFKKLIMKCIAFTKKCQFDNSAS